MLMDKDRTRFEAFTWMFHTNRNLILRSGRAGVLADELPSADSSGGRQTGKRRTAQTGSWIKERGGHANADTVS